MCTLILSTPNTTQAQIPVGGRIIWSYECGCSGGWMFFVLDSYSKSTVPLVFQFGVSRLNANYNIFSRGVNVLGSYTPGGICLRASEGCTSSKIPPIGTISTYGMPGIGTSSF